MQIPRPNAKIYPFSESQFDMLMKNRIAHVLLICSSYDAFILEEDGRIEEQIFNEYVSLSLRYPPQFIQVSTAAEAFKVLREEKIDLIITMLSVGDADSFKLSKDIKTTYNDIPIVVLTPFSREVSLRLSREDLSAIDYVFSWLGNAHLMLAIIKLIEDRMNLDDDVLNNGVQVILMVEDSVRFYSSYLPIIYKLIFQQSQEFMHEGLNEHQKMLRMRGRPKIVLARTYDEAIELFEKYKENILGVISDISYKKEGLRDKLAGFKLVEHIKEVNQYIPILLQSSSLANKDKAKELKVGFIHKYSKALLHELRDFIKFYFAFGDFLFVDPQTGREIMRAGDLKELQKAIPRVPDDSLTYHIKRNHISKWLNARALFPIAEIFKYLTPDDFDDIDHIRDFLAHTISNYRKNKSRGVIAKFYREKYDESLIFTRIGEGSLGGKARGLAFIDQKIKQHWELDKHKDVSVTIPRTLVLATDIFDDYMLHNNLYSFALSEQDDQAILDKFIEAKLPDRIIEDLRAFISFSNNPIAVRSSSLLEDTHYQPFAGVYSTYMVPNSSPDNALNLDQLADAIKCVYASVFYKNTKAYMQATANVIDEEKMSVILQEVCGTKYGNRFYPTFSGVARSVNFYPIAPEKTQDGIATIALGLGRHIVEGGKTLRFSPKYPDKILQLSSPDMALRDTQKKFFALDLQPESFRPSTDDGVNLQHLRIKEAEKDNSIKHIASTYDYANNILRDGVNYEGKKIITFSNILKYKYFPLAEILRDILRVFQKEINNPIEIEFAVNLNVPAGTPKIFNLLQIRPIVENKNTQNVDLSTIDEHDVLISSNSALGNGVVDDIVDLIYVKTEAFDPANNAKIVPVIEKLNEQMLEQNKNYILVGPGRWGSSDPWLGIPVKWSNISAARLIIESGLANYRIDPSQGTHFFQNLTSFHVGYFTLNSEIGDGKYDQEFLKQIPAVYEDKYVRHIRVKKPFVVKINGVENKGILMKPKL